MQKNRPSRKQEKQEQQETEQKELQKSRPTKRKKTKNQRNITHPTLTTTLSPRAQDNFPSKSVKVIYLSLSLNINTVSHIVEARSHYKMVHMFKE